MITGTRADYGLLYWLLKALEKDPGIDLKIIATGAHLSPEFGYTINSIEQDGFIVDEKLTTLMSGDSAASVCKSVGLGVIGFADAYSRLKPDLLVVLGDRVEALAAAQAAMIFKIPIAHIHGGEVTEGAIDEAIRHSITKMSHIHFTATEEYRKRVIQLGESPERVFNFGAPGVEMIQRMQFWSRDEVEELLGFRLREINFLVTYHPVTLDDAEPAEKVRELLKALTCYEDAGIVFTYPNSDTLSRGIIEEIKSFQSKHSDRTIFVPSLGQRLYLSTAKEMHAVIGNSSSGLIEIPSLKTATVNVGDRQRGRIRADSVIQCLDDSVSIAAAIDRSLERPFRATLDSTVNPYGNGMVSDKILGVLKSLPLKGLIRKSFFNID